MFIARSSKGVETIHSIEPYYNRLHDKWISLGTVEVPKGTMKLLGILSLEIASYEVNHYTNNSAHIENINKINF